jgi:hypothetical protein
MNNLDGVPGPQTRSAALAEGVSDADDLRRQAEGCRQLAALALKPKHRVFWMRLAEEWEPPEMPMTARRRVFRPSIDRVGD